MNAQESLVHDLECATDFRFRKAAEYPGDERNEEAVSLLANLQEQVSQLDPSDPVLAAFAEVYDTAVSSEADLTVIREKNSQYFSRVGFDHWPSTASDLLKNLTEIWAPALEEAA